MFIVMDSLGNIPIFYSMLGNLNEKIKHDRIKKIIIASSIILIFFLMFGNLILSFFNITLSDFKLAGGIILFIIALKFILGIRILEHQKNHSFAIVPIATPLIVGPGVITTVIILTNIYGFFITLIASLLNLALTLLILKKSQFLFTFLGKQGSDILSRIMGLILAAIAVNFIKAGWNFF